MKRGDVGVSDSAKEVMVTEPTVQRSSMPPPAVPGSTLPFIVLSDPPVKYRTGVGDNVVLQDALVEYTDCIRDQGFDVGDITLGGPGPGGPNADGAQNAPEAGQGQGDNARGGNRQGGFGDPAQRLANRLGLDMEDPDVQAALEVCQPIIDEAFTGFGPGAGGPAAPAAG